MEAVTITQLAFDLLVVLTVGLLSGVVCKRWRVSLMVGYMVAGAIVGEGGFSLLRKRSMSWSVTGDHRVTAMAIAKDLGFAEDDSQVATGADLMGTSEAELSELVNRIRVFARVTPRQKLQLVNAMNEDQHETL